MKRFCLLLLINGMQLFAQVTITSHNPTQNLIDVAASSNLTVVFSTAMNTATMNAFSSFKVEGSMSGLHDGDFSGNGNSTITFNPADNFEYGETITVTLTTGIQSVGGSALVNDYTFQFVVEATAGTGFFNNSINSLGASASYSVAMGDLDEDGYIDAVVANANQAQAVWLNNGSGGYSSGTSFGSGNSSAIKLGDLDGDGDLDALIANNGGNEEVWLNNGSGNFGGSVFDTFGGGSSREVALGDVDGDGDLDAVIANFNAAQQVWLNNGSGNFGAAAFDEFGSGFSTGITLGDMDGDGDLDAVVANYHPAGSQDNEIWLNDGSGNFGSSAYDGFESGNSNHLAVGDLNGDGHLDVVVGNYGTNTVWINNGSGNMGASSHDTFGSGTNTMSISLGDVDHDGDLDVVAGNYGLSQQIWLNNGGVQGGTLGDFGTAAANSFDAGNTRFAALADVDGNGTLDVFSANESQANTVYLNQLHTQVVSHTPNKNTLDVGQSSLLSVTFNHSILGTSLNDDLTFNVDGSISGEHSGAFSGQGSSTITFNPDSSFNAGEVVTVTLTTGIQSTVGTPMAEGFSFQFTVDAPYGWGSFFDSGNTLGSENSLGTALGDLDGDGDLDAVVVNQNEVNKVWINDGSGGYSDSGQILGTSDSRGAVALGDLDGDGDLDIYVGQFSSANKVWLNNGSGIFTDSGQSLGSAGTYDVALGDVDGDGDLDAVAGNWTDAKKIWLNDGSGTFTDSGQSLGTTSCTGVLLGDLDGDGDLDLFISHWIQPNEVWLNDGAGTFTNSGQSLGSFKSLGAVLGDVDGDGDLDAVVANSEQANMVYYNTGSGIFWDTGQDLGSGNSQSVQLGDLDGDGDLDAYVTNSGANKVYVNNGGAQGGTLGIFIDSGNDYSTYTGTDVALGDLDGDDDLDAFVVNNNMPNIVWLNSAFDRGDLPPDYYISLQGHNGASHERVYTGQITLGASIDNEMDGQESADAGRAGNSGDDNSAGSDDEDGVGAYGVWREGANGGAVIVIVTGGSGYLSAWIDWNDDNDFDDAGEQIFNMQAVTAGTDTLDFDVPAGAIPTYATYNRFSRFRLDDTNTSAMTTTGLVSNGEVEDHYLQFTGINMWVLSHTPAQNAINVSAGSNISVTFNKNINGATLEDGVPGSIMGTFNVDGSMSGEHQGAFSGEGTTTITFNPTKNFEYGEIVTVTLTSGIQSTDGGGLHPYTTQLTVEAAQGWGNFGTQQVITTSAYWANDVYAADVDGDGDLDVLSASQGYDKIAWYENTDGNGSFGTQQVITTEADNARSVYAADLDGDGDLDVLSASAGDHKIAWYENTDGNGSFGTQQVISPTAIGARSVYAADLDGDGDLDVLSASANNKIAWYENTDGNGSFGTQQVITTLVSEAQSVYATDLDGDGDLDVLSASYLDDKIAWYENTDGNGSFGTQQVITISAKYAADVYAADLDGDGDLDVLSASYFDNKIAWYENTDGNGSFGTHQVITTSAANAGSVYAADMDGDGDLDVLSASYLDDKIAWYENTDGNGSFGTQQVITTLVSEARSVYAADLDGDGDLDVLSASYWDHKIAWYENRGSGVLVQARVFLEGPYNDTSNEMSTAIHSEIPLTSPYSEDARTVGSIPTTITDWVLVELRSTTDGAAVASMSAFLRKDGKIVADDGTTEYITMEANPGDYFIVIKHRNHLAVMSDEVHTLAEGSSTLYDFTVDGEIGEDYDKYYGAEGAAVLEGTGENKIYGMFAGDVNQNGEITTEDYTAWYNDARTGASGYQTCDINLNGEVTTEDYTLWYNNARIGASSNVPNP